MNNTRYTREMKEEGAGLCVNACFCLIQSTTQIDSCQLVWLSERRLIFLSGGIILYAPFIMLCSYADYIK